MRQVSDTASSALRSQMVLNPVYREMARISRILHDVPQTSGSIVLYMYLTDLAGALILFSSN